MNYSESPLQTCFSPSGNEMFSSINSASLASFLSPRDFEFFSPIPPSHPIELEELSFSSHTTAPSSSSSSSTHHHNNNNNISSQDQQDTEFLLKSLVDETPSNIPTLTSPYLFSPLSSLNPIFPSSTPNHMMFSPPRSFVHSSSSSSSSSSPASSSTPSPGSSLTPPPPTSTPSPSSTTPTKHSTSTSSRTAKTNCCDSPRGRGGVGRGRGGGGGGGTGGGSCSEPECELGDDHCDANCPASQYECCSNEYPNGVKGKSETTSQLANRKREREDAVDITSKLSPHLLLHLSILQQLDSTKQHCIVKLEDLVALQEEISQLKTKLAEVTTNCTCKNLNQNTSPGIPDSTKRQKSQNGYNTNNS